MNGRMNHLEEIQRSINGNFRSLALQRKNLKKHLARNEKKLHRNVWKHKFCDKDGKYIGNKKPGNSVAEIKRYLAGVTAARRAKKPAGRQNQGTYTMAQKYSFLSQQVLDDPLNQDGGFVLAQDHFFEGASPRKSASPRRNSPRRHAIRRSSTVKNLGQGALRRGSQTKPLPKLKKSSSQPTIRLSTGGNATRADTDGQLSSGTGARASTTQSPIKVSIDNILEGDEENGGNESARSNRSKTSARSNRSAGSAGSAGSARSTTSAESSRKSKVDLIAAPVQWPPKRERRASVHRERMMELRDSWVRDDSLRTPLGSFSEDNDEL